MSLKQQFEFVHQRIRHACQRSGRDPSSVTLVCVTKGISPEAIQQAIALGVTDIGENRVQEARTKRTILEEWFRAQGSGLRAVAHSPEPPTQSAAGRSPQQIRWHLIGHLQRNKAKLAVELFDVVHSVDSLELIEELDRQAARLALGSRLEALGKSRGLQPPASSLQLIEVFIQVNVSGEETKFGCRPEEIKPLAQAISKCQRLKFVGFMTMAPFTEDPELARPYFRHLRQLRDDLVVALSLEPSALSLSMGMSQDFEVAIEEGADFVRIGSAIFS